jgi:hypothetical protein
MDLEYGAVKQLGQGLTGSPSSRVPKLARGYLSKSGIFFWLGQRSAMSSNSTSQSQSDETRPLLTSPVAASSKAQYQPDEGDEVPARLTNHIYVSHFLSTWNSRVFEFGAVLYLATIFPGTLLPMSVYALTRGLSAVLFAPAVGQYIDTSDRLQVVRLSIGDDSEHHAIKSTTFMDD